MDGYIEAAELPHDLVPRWESRCPGRFFYELQDLIAGGATPLYIHEAALKAGALALKFDWKLKSGNVITLLATFPDSFPHLRPQVNLIAGIDLPPRHINPLGGNLCLLGRDTAQWPRKWTLRKLLDSQLEHAIAGTGDQDPQGEPAEVWWNLIGTKNAYCLVDSAWPMSGERGMLTLQYIVEASKLTTPRPPEGQHHSPIIRALVAEVRDDTDVVVETWKGPVPSALRQKKTPWRIPWVRLPSPFVPAPSDDGRNAQYKQLLDPLFPNLQRIAVPATDLVVAMIAVVYPSELTETGAGVGWTFIKLSGEKEAFDERPKTKRFLRKHPRLVQPIPTYRAGPSDLGHRVPAVKTLYDKRILVVGTGAIGAPIVLELARNGCATLQLIEHDVLEPGNSVRWPLGASAWGTRKLRALEKFIDAEYPSTKVIAEHFNLGSDKDDELLTAAIGEAHLVIDASASHGITSLLDERCRQQTVPLITVSATPSVKGGVVVRHAGDGGCPNCLEYAWEKKAFAEPTGRWDDALTQPPGCAERTFTGASHDLQELSLQAVRLTLQTLDEPAAASLVLTLDFVDEGGLRLPKWRIDALPRHPDCRCRG